MSEVISDQWCRTIIETPFTWTIEDFASRTEKLSSSIFLAYRPDGKTSSWKLLLYPKREKGADTHLSIFLKTRNDFPIEATFRVSILDSSSKKTCTWEPTSDVLLFDSRNPIWGVKKWAFRDSIINSQKLLPGGNLTIFCVVFVFGTAKILSGSHELDIKSGTNARRLEQVSEDIGKLFNDKEFSDVEIECAGEIFNCHRAILSTRSDYFRAMFQADMAENRTKKVTITDIDSEVAGEMLHFIYTGGTNENPLKERSKELLAAADKYQLDVLKSICEDHLCTNLQIDNAIENFVFGDLHRASKLRRMAMKVVARNLVKIVKTEEYRNLVKLHPSLAAEIPMALVEDEIIK